MRRSLFLLAVLLLAGTAAAQDGGRRRPDVRRGFHAPELAITASGDVLLLWSRLIADGEGGAGHHLFVARREGDGPMGASHRLSGDQPVRFDDAEESRPRWITGAKGFVAVAWMSDRDQPTLAWSATDGRDFAEPVRLDSAPALAVPTVLRDRAGQIHAAWWARGDSGVQLRSVVLRNGRLGKVVASDAPEGGRFCSAQPVLGDPRGNPRFVFLLRTAEQTESWSFFPDASGPGKLEVLGEALRGEDCDALGLLSSPDGWMVWDAQRQLTVQTLGHHERRWREVYRGAHEDIRSARFVPGSSGETMLFLTGTSGMLLRRVDGRWDPSTAALPPWTRSVVEIDGELLVVGDIQGELRLEAREY